MPTPSNIFFQVPTSWSGFSQRQLSYYYSLLAAGYDTPELRLRLFLHCARLTPATPPRHAKTSDHYYYHPMHAKTLRITANEIEVHLSEFNFLQEPPTFPMLAPIANKHPVPPMLNEMPFGQFLELQNYYVQFLLYNRSEALTAIARILWRFEDEEPDPTPDDELIYHAAIHLYMAGLSPWLARQFPELFRGEGGGNLDTERQREQTNAMIRALTAGDITREEAVLKAYAHRALTELNEKAREARELKAASK